MSPFPVFTPHKVIGGDREEREYPKRALLGGREGEKAVNSIESIRSEYQGALQRMDDSFQLVQDKAALRFLLGDSPTQIDDSYMNL